MYSQGFKLANVPCQYWSAGQLLIPIVLWFLHTLEARTARGYRGKFLVGLARIPLNIYRKLS